MNFLIIDINNKERYDTPEMVLKEISKVVNKMNKVVDKECFTYYALSIKHEELKHLLMLKTEN